jgi:hypothetical protein
LSLTYREKKLIKVLEENPDINTRKFIELSGLGKTTFYKYSDRLEISGYISFHMIKNERVWRLVRKNKKQDLGLQDLDDPQKLMEKRYQEIESKIMKSLQKIRKDNISEKIDVYGNAVVLILATLASLKLISIYRNKRLPNIYIQFIKKIELLLEKISDAKFFSDYGFGRVAIDNIVFDAEDKLDKFLGINSDEDKKITIY